MPPILVVSKSNLLWCDIWCYCPSKKDSILVERPIGSQAHSDVRDLLADSLSSLGWTVELDPVATATTDGFRNFTNVIAQLHPDRPRRAVLGGDIALFSPPQKTNLIPTPQACHYDSLIWLEGFVGAIDSAVPCAMLLNLVISTTTFSAIPSPVYVSRFFPRPPR